MSKEEGRLNAIKEELEEMIEQIKSEVDKKDQDLAHFKKRQDESFDMISFKMEKLKEDFKTFGKYLSREQTVQTFSSLPSSDRNGELGKCSERLEEQAPRTD